MKTNRQSHPAAARSAAACMLLTALAPVGTAPAGEPGPARNASQARPATAGNLEEPTHGPFQPVAKCKEFTLGTRPWDGRVGSDGSYDLWMRVPGKEKREYRIAPTVFADGTTTTLNASCEPDEGLVSPDARWVALSQKYCRGYGVGFLLKRDTEAGMKPLPRLVSEMGWDLFFAGNPEAAKKRHDMNGISSYSEASICDLVGWDADSSGVWYALRGGSRGREGIYRWYFRWDVTNGKVSVPERVRAINEQAAARYAGETLSEEQIKVEEDHVLFLAELEWRLKHPAAKLDRQAAQKAAQPAITALHRPGEPLNGSDAWQLIDGGPAASLLKTGLAVGAKATAR